MDRRIIEFGPFRLDLALKELRRRGVRIPVPASQIRLLQFFLDHRSGLVTREQIAACLWGDSSTIDQGSGINTAVNRLRSSLGDDPASPKYIETVVGVGYRFVAAVSETGPPGVTAVTPSAGQPQLSLAADLRRPEIQLESSSGTESSGDEKLDLESAPSASMPAPAPTLPAQPPHAQFLPRQWKWIALGAFLLFAIALTSVLIRRSQLRNLPVRRELEVTQVTQSGDVQFADISADGRFIALVRDSGGKRTVWLKQLVSGQLLQVADLGSDDCPGVAFSPDAGFVLFARKKPNEASGDLFRLPFLGGTPVKLLSGVSGAPAVSPDGRSIAFVRSTLASHGEDSVVTAAIDGTGERTLATYQAPGIHFNRITWTADGKSLVYPLRSELTMISASGGAAQPIRMEPWRSVDDLSSLPPDHQLIVAGELSSNSHAQIFQVSTDGSEIQPLSHDLSSYTGVRSAADGKTLLAVQDRILTSIQILAPGSRSEPRILTPEKESLDGVHGLAWMPDGRILFSSDGGTGHSRALLKISADGSNAGTVASAEDIESLSQPVVSSRGDFLVLVRWFGKDQANLWRIDLKDGSKTQLTHGLQDLSASITPDGEWIIYSTTERDKSVLMKVSAHGGTAHPLTDFNAQDPSVSPDGRWIACSYVPAPGQAVGLAILPISGGKPIRVFSLPSGSALSPLVWAPNGRSVFFINELGTVGNIWQAPVAGGASVPITHFTVGRIFNFQRSSDGQLLLSRGTEIQDAVLFHPSTN